MRIVDLSTPHQNGASEPYPPQIVYRDHASGAARLGTLAGVAPESFPGGIALATEQITASAHSGTHVDAPWHYGPTCEGRAARTIDEVPLEWLYAPGVVLDLRAAAPGSAISARQIEAALEAIPHRIAPGEIVLIHTGTARWWMTDQYLSRQPGLSREATEWLVTRGVRVIGIDAWGLDRAVPAMAAAHRAGEPDALWPAHFYGREREYLQIEKLANLDQLPPTGFIVCAFPVKVERASAGWCRAVAIFHDEEPS